MPKDLDPKAAEDIEAIIATGRQKPLNFVMMKTKEAVVLKAHPIQKCDKLLREAKAEGGMPAFMASGVLNVSGRQMQFKAEDEVPPSLPKSFKQYLMALKVKAKFEFLLPGGAVLGEDGVAPVEGETETPEVETEAPAPEGEGEGLSPKLKELAERLKALAPRIQALAGTDAKRAEVLSRALQRAVAEIKAGSVEKARPLVDGIEQALGPVAPEGAPPKADPEAEKRAQLAKEFEGLRESLKKLVSGADEAVGKKATSIVKIFADTLKTDTEKAEKALQALKLFLNAELEKLAKTAKSVGEAIEEGAEALSQGVQDLFRPEDDKKDMAALMALGLSWDEADKLVDGKSGDPKAVEKVLTGRLEKAGVPAGRRGKLLEMSRSNPEVFAATVKAMDEMDKGGAVDISPAKLQESREALEKARAENEKAEAALASAQAELDKVNAAYKDASGKVGPAREAATKAAQALKDFQDNLGDVSKLGPQEAAEKARQGAALINASEEAKKALEKAVEAEKQASMDYAAASDKVTKADAAADKTKGPLEKARKEDEKKQGKKALLDAISFGPLSPGNGKLSDEDKAGIAAAFSKDPVVAQSGMRIAMGSENPSAVAKNLGMVAGKAQDGFADEKGNRLDLPEEDRRKMAENALRMGGMMGEDYFKGFDAYLKSGKQLDPDPFGSLDEPLKDPKAESLRKKDIGIKRTAAMGEAVLGPDGKVDFSSDKARAAMDQMLFHPGSLKVATPLANAKIAETKKLFEDPATKDRAGAVIDRTKLPANGSPGRVAGLDLVGRTLGKTPGELTDGDAKVAVLSAMMTPLSQDTVGSCFATAQTRAIRESDPVRAMDEFSKLATTGLYTDASGMQYPANRTAPKGDNPLMRSWEFSVATATEEQANSPRRSKLTGALMQGGTPPKGLSAMKSIPGLGAKWATGGIAPDGGLEDGIETKLRRAIALDLKFEYAAEIVLPPGPGGGDGSSTEGIYQIFYKGKLVDSEAAFKEAMQAIGLAAAGVQAGSTEGKAIVALVNSPAFVTQILDSYGPPPAEGKRKSPWNLGGGAFPAPTKKVLNGGNPGYSELSPANSGTPPQPISDRNKAVLKGLLQSHAGTPGDWGTIWTAGAGANHVLNTLPNDPSVKKLQGGNIDAKIESELMEPGRKIRDGKLPADQAAKLYADQLEETMKGLPAAERTLIVAALKNAPTTEMTPKEVNAKVKAELAGWRDVAAQRRLDAWFDEENKSRKAKGQAELPPASKAGYLNWFKDNIQKQIDGRMELQMISALAPPEAVVADTNWGGSDWHRLFVMIPDPLTGDLKMYQKDKVSGAITPAGDQWSNAQFQSVR